MSGGTNTTRAAYWIIALLITHFAGYAILSFLSIMKPLELFNIMMLAFNSCCAWFIIKRGISPLIGGAIMTMVAAHTFAGQFLAPDNLTSAAILLANILTVYTGYRIYISLPSGYWYAFIANYALLFAIFILSLRNAEPLFILFLMAMVACARSYRLMAYFWAAVASFSFFQPYAWESLIALFLIIGAVTGAKGAYRSLSAKLFLCCGLSFLFLVLLPVLITIAGSDMSNIFYLLRDARIVSALKVTLITATISTILLTIFMVPLAYALSRFRFRGRSLILALIDLPIVIPQSAAGIALVQVFGRNQPIGEFFNATFGVHIDGTVIGVCVAQIFVAMPFIARSSMVGFDSVNVNLELTAQSLGASPLRSFLRVSVPLAARGIGAGVILAWARAAGEFGTLLFIAPTPESAPVAAYNRFNSMGTAEAAPLVAMMLMFSLAMFFILQMLTYALPRQHGHETGQETS